MHLAYTSENNLDAGDLLINDWLLRTVDEERLFLTKVKEGSAFPCLLIQEQKCGPNLTAFREILSRENLSLRKMKGYFHDRTAFEDHRPRPLAAGPSR